MFNLLNFPHNLEELVQQEEPKVQKNMPISKWIHLIQATRNLNSKALSERLKVSTEELEEMKTNTELPSSNLLLRLLGLLE